jgi:hypothetical protein
MEAWRSHFDQLLNHDSPVNALIGFVKPTDYGETDVIAPSSDKIGHAITRLKNFKSPGADEVTA